MADISKDQYRELDSRRIYEDVWVLDNSAAQTVYVGSPMIIDQNVDTIYPRIFDSNVTLASTDVFIGFALEAKVVATTDTETDNKIPIAGHGTGYGIPKGSFTNADAGKTIYMSDSGTFTTTSTSNLNIGKLIEVRGSWAYIELERQIQSHV